MFSKSKKKTSDREVPEKPVFESERIRSVKLWPIFELESATPHCTHLVGIYQCKTVENVDFIALVKRTICTIASKILKGSCFFLWTIDTAEGFLQIIVSEYAPRII